jgi:hypothetical protein
MKKALLFIPISALFYGCGGEPVQTYKAPKEPVAAQPMQAPAHAAPAQPAGKGFTADLPSGWAESPGSGMRIISYTIEGTSIDFYLISLSMGDLPSNVNRWRGQVGLDPASPDEIVKETQVFDIGAHQTQFIEIYNMDEGKGIIAAIINLEPQYWYFTAKGNVDELKAHAGDIRAFLESIEFEGHSH